MNSYALTAHEAQEMIRTGRLKPSTLWSDLKARSEVVEPRVHAFARAPFWGRVPENASGLLAGMPIVLKDNICSDGDLTECASRILGGFRAPYDATVVTRLKAAGAVIQGKANMDEFAFGSSCETSTFGPTKNPWDLTRVPGGSSGGSAACVAADEALWALGSDTGGSIRQPASFCGIVGMKPTYGRVSRYGLIAFASSLDQIGPMTKCVRDNALCLGVIAGHDPMDATSSPQPVPDYAAALSKDIKRLKVGLPKEFFIEGLDPEVKAAVDAAVAHLKKQGVTFIDVSLPHSAYAVAVYYIVATAEASSNLARFDGVQYGLRSASRGATGEGAFISMVKRTREEGFGPEAKRRIILGTYVLSSGYYDAYYDRALKVRSLIKADFDKAFKACDLIFTPTSPTAAFRLGEKTEDPLSMYLSDIYTISANLAGIPGLSLPGGMTKSGLPIGLQILGPSFAEEDIYRLAFAYEQATPWHTLKPVL
jgi:aspartyl-tRNA(Asn)/glutamyl-tRNA(Gln) amidotransferase subunit A